MSPEILPPEYVALGRQLREAKATGSYIQPWGSWQAYCREVFGLPTGLAHKVMSATQVYDELERMGCKVLPADYGQAEPFVPYLADLVWLRRVWLTANGLPDKRGHHWRTQVIVFGLLGGLTLGTVLTGLWWLWQRT